MVRVNEINHKSPCARVQVYNQRRYSSVVELWIQVKAVAIGLTASSKTNKCVQNTLRCSVVALNPDLKKQNKKNSYVRVAHRYSGEYITWPVRERGNPTTWNHSCQISATLPRCLQVTKTAADLPHCCSESTKDSIAGWCSFGFM